MREGRGIIKKYLAICAGIPEKSSALIRLDIEVNGKIKKSETRYKLLESSKFHGTFSLIELELGTGRMHQIRRHLAMTKTPILGDDKYGNFTLNKNLRKTHNLKHLLLHASGLQIPQAPGTQALNIEAPLPGYFQDFCQKAGVF